MPVYEDFLNKIDQFVNNKLHNYTPTDSYGKVIHDPIWGSVFYYHWEIQIIDAPLYQRLRDINQVGLAMLTYPAARHSRFEHSLGTVAIASRIFERIMEKNRRAGSEVIPYLNDEGLYLIRLAALLHDIGHCFYSHLSETIYGETDAFKELIDEFKESHEGIKPKAHEILSFLIINTPSFIDFFKKRVDYPDKSDCEQLMGMVGNIIVGVPNKNEDMEKRQVFSYLTSLINGDFDADKLDYIMRDSYTAGLALTYDIERFLYKINIYNHDTEGDINYLLVIEFSGITSVEELTFSKLMLFSYIYHHQKILAAEAVLRDVVFGMINLGIVEHPCDFLALTDSDIMARLKNDDRKPFDGSNKTLGDLIKQVAERDLPKKCFVLNRKMVRIDESDVKRQKESILKECYDMITKSNEEGLACAFLENFAMQYTRLDDGNHSNGIRSLEDTLNKYRKNTYEQYIELRKKFHTCLAEEYKKNGLEIDFDFLDIHIIIPKKANFTSSNSTVVLFPDKHLQELSTVMNLNDWGDSFNANKWNGYVFVNSNINIKMAYSTAEKIIIDNQAIKLVNSESYVKHLAEM